MFIGGNHEASNFLQELPYGGWVAPNIFYMGYVGVFKVGSLRIAGVSGIYKVWVKQLFTKEAKYLKNMFTYFAKKHFQGHDYLKGRHEHPPYSQNTIRSVYHYRNLDIFRLKQVYFWFFKNIPIN